MKQFMNRVSSKLTGWIRYLRNILFIRFIRVIEILKTPYKNLVFDDNLNYRIWKNKSSAIKLLSEEKSLKFQEIGNIRFYWPSEYDNKGLDGIYIDTFAPISCNPHIYEIGDVNIKKGDWVVDAGTCEGFFTWYALSRGANVLMIEPISRLAEALSHTFKDEMKSGKVRLLHGALGAQTGMIDIAISEAGPIASSIDPNWKINNNWIFDKSLELKNPKTNVNVYSLDDILEYGILPTIDFLKMDIENGEVGAFQGATKLLSQIMPKLSIAVYHEFPNAQIIRSQILKVQPKYKVKWRGIFYRESFGRPRPYMLYASGKKL